MIPVTILTVIWICWYVVKNVLRAFENVRVKFTYVLRSTSNSLKDCVFQRTLLALTDIKQHYHHWYTTRILHNYASAIRKYGSVKFRSNYGV
jgi:hypothetical protein